MYEKSDRGQVAWDIETTEFGWSEVITVSGFWFPDGHATLVVNAGPHSVDERPQHLSEVSDASVSVSVADDERELLGEMRRLIFERFDRDYNRLVAYNAES